MVLASRQLIKNTFWSLLDVGLYPLLMLVATPLFINYMGLEQYGIWMMATTVNQFMNVLNFGLGDATIHIIASNRAENNTLKIKECVTKNWSLAIAICLLACFIGCTLAFSGLVQYWFHVPHVSFFSSKLVLSLAFTSTAIKFMELVLLSVFKGFERFDYSARLSLISRNSMILASIILVIMGCDLVTVFLGIVITNLCNVLLQLASVKKLFPFLQFKPSFRFQFKFENTQHYWYWLQSVIGMFGFLSDRLIVGYFTNIKVLGLYATASLIGSQLHNALVALGTFLFPKVAYQKKMNTNLLPLYYNSRFIIASLGWIITYLALLLSPFVFKWWLGEEVYILSESYIHLYLVFIAFMTLTIIPYQFINGSDVLHYNTWQELSLRSSHIIFMLIGFYFNGVSGLLWGLIAATSINIPIQYYFFHKHFFEWTAVLKSCLVIIPPLSFVVFVEVNGVLLKALCIFLFSISLFFIYFKPSSIQNWKKA